MEVPTPAAMAAALVVLVLILPFSVREASAQPACAEKLVPCESFMNVTSPPASCCESLKDAMTNDLPCLCGFYNSPGFFKSLNFPARCNLTIDLSDCSKASPTNSASQPPPPPPPAGNNGHVLGALSLSCAMPFFSLFFH